MELPKTNLYHQNHSLSHLHLLYTPHGMVHLSLIGPIIVDILFLYLHQHPQEDQQ